MVDGPAERLRPSEEAKTDLLRSTREQLSRGTVDMSAAAGDVVTVTKGKEDFYPIKFNGFEVGPLTISGAVRPGETYQTAYMRLSSILEHLFEAEFNVKLQSYREHVVSARVAT